MLFTSAAISSLLICASFVQAAQMRSPCGIPDLPECPDFGFSCGRIGGPECPVPVFPCRRSDLPLCPDATTSSSETATATSTATGLNKRTDYGINGAYGINGPYGVGSAASPAPEVSPVTPVTPVVPPLPGFPPAVARRSLATRRNSINPVVMYWKDYKITGNDNDKMYDCVLPMNSRWPLLNDATCPVLIGISNPRPECFETDKKADEQFRSCAKSTNTGLTKYKQ